MAIGVYQLALTTNSAAAGTASTRLFSGEIVSVRLGNAGTALVGPGATATFKLTDAVTGGTILNLTGVTAPFQYQPRNLIHTTSGGTTFQAAGTVGGAWDPSGVAFAGSVTAVVTQGGTSTAGTVYITYRR